MPSNRRFLTLFSFFLVFFLLSVIVSQSIVQLSFVLDLDDSLINYTENALNDSSTSKDLIFTGSQNKTEWISIPKNSTILFTNISFAGVMTPIFNILIDPINDLAAGDVNLTNPWDEIVVGTSSGSYVKMYNSSGSLIWENPIGGDVYGVDIGNLSSDIGSEIVAGATDYKIYIFNSSGDEKLNVSVGGYVWDIDAGEVDSTNDYDEIAVAGDDNKVYLFDSSLSEMWNYSGTNPFKGVGIGNLSNDIGNEVVAGSNDFKVYLFNSSGDLKWNISIGVGINDVSTGNVDPSSDYDEIAVAGSNGTVFLLDYTGSVLWTYTTTPGTVVDTVYIDEVTTEYNENEVVAGSLDDKVYVLNVSGGLIWNYTTENDVRGIGVGNLTSDLGNEIAAGTSFKGGQTYNLYVLNFEYFPTNPTLDIGDDGSLEWNYTGKFRTSTWVSNDTVFQNYLTTCTADATGNCNIPLRFSSEYAGDLKINSINVTYQYNFSDIVSSEIKSVWTKTSDVWVNESVGNQTKNITYSRNPAVDVNVKYVKIDNSATKCAFNGTSYVVGTVDGTVVCNISTLNHKIPSSGQLFYDTVWDDSMTFGIPVLKNESSETLGEGFWKKNITIWNDTTTIFYNIIANTTLNESEVISNPKLKVDWYNNGTLFDITPGSPSSDCNTSSPTYSDMAVGGDTFKVCMQDIVGSGVADLFVWKQPHTINRTYVMYEASGSTNYAPTLDGFNVTPSEDIWGNEFNISVNMSDTEDDNVTVKLWIYITNLDSWGIQGEKNVTGNQTVIFNITTNKSWVGNNQFKFEYADFNFSESVQPYHDWQNTSVGYGPNATKHDTIVSYIQAPSAINRTDSALLIVQLNDSDSNNATISDANCSFWITLSNGDWDEGYLTVSNNTGHCNYTFNANSSYIPGERWWKGGTFQDNYYKDENSTNFSLTIYGRLNINITTTKNFTRGVTNVLEAQLYDEFNSSVLLSGYNCSWYINNSYNTSTLTNSNGVCNFTWNTGNCENLGLYLINVSLTNGTSPDDYYSIDKNNSFLNTTLKDDLTLTIVSPSTNAIYHMGDTIELNSTVQDSCGLPSYAYNVTWNGNGTSDTPQVCNFTSLKEGYNTTWDVTSNCGPELFVIEANATGKYYNLAKKNVTVWIYGWSNVNVTFPINDSTIERTEYNRMINITCYVYNQELAPPNDYIQDYPVKIWKIYSGSEELLNSTKTNQSGYAKYSWNISDSVQVPDGQYKIKCNITDMNVSYYRYYNTSISSDISEIIIIENDTAPPTISGISANSVMPEGDVTIQASVTDWYGVNHTWVNVTYPNSSSFIFTMQNTTPNLVNTTWEVTLNNLTQVGDYDIIVFANDSIGGANHTSNSSDWFEVYLPIQMYINASYPIDFTFYRSGTSSIIHSFLNDSGEYNYSLHKRNYDFLSKISDAYGQNHSVKFNNMNSTATAEAQFGTADNITDPLYITNISLALLTPPVPSREHELAAIEVSSNMVYSNITITLDYSRQLSLVDYEPAIRMYKCSGWSNNTCNSGWTEVSSSPDTNLHTISTIQSNASVYYAFEAEICGNGLCGAGESCVNCAGDCGICPPPGGPGSPGGPGGISPYCGNAVCEAGENEQNCPEDCAEAIFTLKTNMTDAQIDLGEMKNFALWIGNKLNQRLNLSLSMTGTVSTIASLAKKTLLIDAQDEEIVGINAFATKTLAPGAYTGEIVVTGSGRTERTPVKLTVSTGGAIVLDVLVEAVTKSIGPNEMGRFHIMLYNLGIKKEFDAVLTYTIKDSETEKVIYQKSEIKAMETSESFVEEILIPSDAVEGSYILMLEASYDGRKSTSSDTFEITHVFWTYERMRIIVISSLSVSAIIFLVYSKRKYILWKIAKARYIFPIHIRKLPKGKIWLGKVAETQARATFDINDLTTHVLIAGATGSGKSVTGNIFAEELLDKKVPIVVFDPTSQWTGFVRPCRDENVLKYYKEFSLGLKDTRSYNGMIYEVKDPKIEIDFKNYMNPGEITIFVLSKLKPGDYDEAVSNIIDSIFEQRWEESTELKLIIVFDEVHRLLEKYGGKGGYVTLEKACREFRKWGIGLIMISQVLSDFKEAIKGNVLTEIQMHTKGLGDLGRVEKKYGLEYAKRVAREEVGVGMMQNPKYNDGIPWFISFRPPLHMPHKIPENDMEAYKELSDLIEMIEREISKLEKEGKDVFNLKIELKLAKSKLKQGRFRMAEIYIESLKKILGK